MLDLDKKKDLENRKPSWREWSAGGLLAAIFIYQIVVETKVFAFNALPNYLFFFSFPFILFIYLLLLRFDWLSTFIRSFKTFKLGGFEAEFYKKVDEAKITMDILLKISSDIMQYQLSNVGYKNLYANQFHSVDFLISKIQEQYNSTQLPDSFYKGIFSGINRALYNQDYLWGIDGKAYEDSLNKTLEEFEQSRIKLEFDEKENLIADNSDVKLRDFELCNTYYFFKRFKEDKDFIKYYKDHFGEKFNKYYSIDSVRTHLIKNKAYFKLIQNLLETVINETH